MFTGSQTLRAAEIAFQHHVGGDESAGNGVQRLR